MSAKPALKLRPAAVTDAAFIFNSWLKCYRHSKSAMQVQNDIYFSAQHKVIEGLVKRAQFIIACSPTDENQIYGYGVGEMVEDVVCVHFIYVKEPYRKLGLACTLLAALGHVPGTPYLYTHRTHVAEKLEKKHPLVYHPYLAFYGFEASK